MDCNQAYGGQEPFRSKAASSVIRFRGSSRSSAQGRARSSPLRHRENDRLKGRRMAELDPSVEPDQPTADFRFEFSSGDLFAPPANQFPPIEGAVDRLSRSKTQFGDDIVEQVARVAFLPPGESRQQRERCRVHAVEHRPHGDRDQSVRTEGAPGTPR